MSTVDRPNLTVDDVQIVAELVDLPLSRSDAAKTAELLSAWIPNAISLNEKMQCEDEVTPITSFDAAAGLGQGVVMKENVD